MVSSQAEIAIAAARPLSPSGPMSRLATTMFATTATSAAATGVAVSLSA